jgi:hypothetical protein
VASQRRRSAATAVAAAAEEDEDALDGDADGGDSLLARACWCA